MFTMHCTFGDIDLTLITLYKHPDVVIKSCQCCNIAWPLYDQRMLLTKNLHTLPRKTDLIASENTHEKSDIYNMFAIMRLLFFQRCRIRNMSTLITKNCSSKKCWTNWWLRTCCNCIFICLCFWQQSNQFMRVDFKSYRTSCTSFHCAVWHAKHVLSKCIERVHREGGFHKIW